MKKSLGSYALVLMAVLTVGVGIAFLSSARVLGSDVTAHSASPAAEEPAEEMPLEAPEGLQLPDGAAESIKIPEEAILLIKALDPALLIGGLWVLMNFATRLAQANEKKRALKVLGPLATLTDLAAVGGVAFLEINININLVLPDNMLMVVTVVFIAGALLNIQATRTAK